MLFLDCVKNLVSIRFILSIGHELLCYYVLFIDLEDPELIHERGSLLCRFKTEVVFLS